MIARICRCLVAFLTTMVLFDPPGLAQEPEPDNERWAFRPSALVGLGIDIFAASELRKYLNPEDSGGVQEQFVAGLDFEYRLFGGDAASGAELWVYAVHGLRSTDVDCEADPTLEVCQRFKDQIASPGGPVLFLLRKATSLEAFGGLCWEFAALQSNDKNGHTAKPYLRAQAGLLTVQAYRHARHTAGLDFLAITEHNHSKAESGAGDRRDRVLIATNPSLYTGPQVEGLIPTANSWTVDGEVLSTSPSSASSWKACGEARECSPFVWSLRGRARVALNSSAGRRRHSVRGGLYA